MKFSESQLNVINHKEGPALVLAVPGSGKTTVLLARINNLINNGINPENILAMTFSKSQAKDMEERYRKIYGNQNIHFSTIHSFTYGVLRKFSKSLSNFQIIENSKDYNKYSIVQQIYLHIRKKYMNDEQLESFFRVSSFLKNTLMDYNDYKKMYSSAFNGFEKVYSIYENFKKTKNLLDFDDILIEALKILQTNKYALKFLQNKFEYIQIDEGQDTSYVQLKIISLISQKNNNLFIVADDDQSIYGFRGADSKQLLDFPKVYPNAKIFYMENNYRSSDNIVKFSNLLIKNNKQRYLKIIKSTKDEGEIVDITATKNTKQQIEFVLQNAIEKLKLNETVAILYRNNLSAISFINSIPEDLDFYIKDSKYAFYSNQIIYDIIDIINFSKDQYDLNLFKKIYYKLNLFIKKEFVKQLEFMDENYDVIERLKDVDGMNSFFLEKVYLLSYYMDKLSSLNFYDAILYILRSMDYYEYVKELSRRTSGSIIAFDRIIDTLINISKDVKTVSEFEQKVQFLINKQKLHSNNSSNLIFSTIHGSKGLEFDNVFMIDLIDKEFPSSYSSSVNEELGILEEERRLFYVGMTRAKKNLTLVYPKKLYVNDTKPSSFIDEIIKK
ncbi:MULTISPECIES: ATP-dependent helicase [Helcococcus]|uniref:DNA 3'-5' helicase n=1 Tax=Helcococcus bovis TaxID=3153252 RepID=A0ABW9F4K1_9FIRM